MQIDEIVITTEDVDTLADYYFGHYAAHNEDEAGCERWLEDLTNEEAKAILEKINK